MTRTYFDGSNDRLVMFEQESTAEFWNQLWDKGRLKERIFRGLKDPMIKSVTRKYLKPQAKILEGGCGIGQFVYAMEQWGYDACGIDYAKDTLEMTLRLFPGLKLAERDVRHTGFPDNHFDGYWSLGVIEHFWDGYAPIVREARRVLKSGGYFFVSFPYFSPLRRYLAARKSYQDFPDNLTDGQFYQFILNPDKVITTFKDAGFEYVSRRAYDPTKSMKDDLRVLAPLLRPVYRSGNIFCKAIKRLNNILFARLCGHMMLLVFRKTG